MLSSTLLLLAGASAVAGQYAPVTGSCPSESLVRSGDGLSANETTYRTARKAKADTALTSWLATTDATFSTDNLPTVSSPKIESPFTLAHYIRLVSPTVVADTDRSYSVVELFKVLMLVTAAPVYLDSTRL